MFYLFCPFNSDPIRSPHILRCDNYYLIMTFSDNYSYLFKYFTCNPSESRTT